MRISEDMTRVGPKEVAKTRMRKKQKRLIMMFPLPRVPPKVIVFHGIKDLPLSTGMNHRRNPGFLISLMDQTINGHDPPCEKAMFFESLETILGTGRHARASISVHRGNGIAIEVDKPHAKVESRSFIRSV
jgi:hypothetical protein